MARAPTSLQRSCSYAREPWDSPNQHGFLRLRKPIEKENTAQILECKIAYGLETHHVHEVPIHKHNPRELSSKACRPAAYFVHLQIDDVLYFLLAISLFLWNRHFYDPHLIHIGFLILGFFHYKNYRNIQPLPGYFLSASLNRPAPFCATCS